MVVGDNLDHSVFSVHHVGPRDGDMNLGCQV